MDRMICSVALIAIGYVVSHYMVGGDLHTQVAALLDVLRAHGIATS